MEEFEDGMKAFMERWLAAVAALGPAAKGSLRDYKRKCGLKGCKRCASGERHPSKMVTYYDESGKQRSAFVGPSQAEEFRTAIENGRKLESLLVRFGQEYLKLLKSRSRRVRGGRKAE